MEPDWCSVTGQTRIRKCTKERTPSMDANEENWNIAFNYGAELPSSAQKSVKYELPVRLVSVARR